MKFPKKIWVAILPVLDIFQVNSSDKDPIEVTGGFELRFLDILSFGLKFNYTVKVPQDMQWGSRKPDGTWSGLIGLVSNNLSDIAISRLVANSERSTAVDFTYPYTIDPVTFSTKPPRFLSKQSSIIRPFSAGLWMYFLITILLISIIFPLLLGDKRNLKYNALHVISAVLLKSVKLRCDKLHEKFLIGFWLIAAMILAYSYMALLLSFLTVPLAGKTVENIPQLSHALDNNQFKCFTFAGSILLKTMLTSKDEYFQNIGRHIERNNWFIPPNVDFGNILKEDNIAVVSQMLGLVKVPRNEIFISKDIINYSFISIAVSKEFCCKAVLDSLIHRIAAAGLYDKFVNDFTFQVQLRARMESKESSTAPRAVTLLDLSGIFLCLLGLYGLSCVVLLIEVLSHNIKTRRFRKL